MFAATEAVSSGAEKLILITGLSDTPYCMPAALPFIVKAVRLKFLGGGVEVVSFFLHETMNVSPNNIIGIFFMLLF